MSMTSSYRPPIDSEVEHDENGIQLLPIHQAQLHGRAARKRDVIGFCMKCAMPFIYYNWFEGAWKCEGCGTNRQAARDNVLVAKFKYDPTYIPPYIPPAKKPRTLEARGFAVHERFRDDIGLPLPQRPAGAPVDVDALGAIVDNPRWVLDWRGAVGGQGAPAAPVRNLLAEGLRDYNDLMFNGAPLEGLVDAIDNNPIPIEVANIVEAVDIVDDWNDLMHDIDEAEDEGE